MLRAINASVEIFVIKTHGILNLPPISSRNINNGPKHIVFFQVPKDHTRLGCQKWRNPQLLAE
jgi:hypothetical protein